MSSEETKSVERVFDEKDRGCSPLLKDIRLGPAIGKGTFKAAMEVVRMSIARSHRMCCKSSEWMIPRRWTIFEKK